MTGKFYQKLAMRTSNGDLTNEEHLMNGVISSMDEISCVGFKVVHAKGVTGVQYLTDDVLQAMADFNSVAPAHNPPYIAAIRQFREIMPQTPMIGSFETAFHKDMPAEDRDSEQRQRKVEIVATYGREEAYEVIQRSLEDYKNHFQNLEEILRHV